MNLAHLGTAIFCGAVFGICIETGNVVYASIMAVCVIVNLIGYGRSYK